jgi:hypothetical protein
MNRALLTGLLVLAAAILTPGLAAAQETESTFLGVGEPAPFSSGPGRLGERFK